MPVTIGRTALTDDDGTGTTGTVINNAWLISLYNQIDAALAALPQGIASSGTKVIQIAFAATQNSSSDANTLDDYEEGTWTPTDGSGASLTFSVASGSYIKIGQLVLANCRVTYPATASGVAAKVGSLPFAAMAAPQFGGYIVFTDYATAVVHVFIGESTALAQFYKGASAGVAINNVDFSGKDVRFVVAYRAGA